MATTKIAPGQVIEAVTEGELVHHLDRYTANWFQEKARGITTFRFDQTGTVAGAAITLPDVGKQQNGPEPGFAWILLAVRAQGLATGDTLNVWRNSAIPRNFLGIVTAAAPATTFGSKSVILKGDEKLIFTGASLTATGDITVNGEGLECAEPDLYKLV
jgi:hypothetical protein